MNEPITDTYKDFLSDKLVAIAPIGFDVEDAAINQKLFPFQRAITQWALKIGRGAIFADCGLGKGQPEGALILTPIGFVPNTQLNVGDMIVASDGLAYPLKAKYIRGLQSTFEVYFSDGSSFVVDANHLHIFRTNNDRQRSKPWRVASTLQLLDMPIRYGKSGKSRNLDIPVVVPIQGERREHWIHPYVLGVLLGDGCITKGCTVTLADEQILETIRAFLPLGWTLMHKSRYDYKLSYGGENKRDFIQELRRLGIFGTRSRTKFIPNEYLFDSVDNRVWLLRGLMDTDGWISDTSQYYSTSKQLADNALTLIRSLGGGPTRALKHTSCIHNGTRRQGAPCHVLTFSLKTFNPFHLARKAAKWNPNPRDNGRWIDRIEERGEQRTICLSVGSGNQSYVTENYIVTHNTPMQLEWARHVCLHTGGKVLILTPLAVARQTIKESEKFGIDARFAASQEDCAGSGIFVTNYQKLKHFNADSFAGIVLDESSILKSYMGKIKQELITLFNRTRFKLCCTATPAPNDHLELGNHAEFLGIMPSNEMIARWFINDSMEFGSYRLRGHAEKDFWRWVSSWAVCLQHPSDLGYSDDGFILPPLEIIEENVDVDITKGAFEEGNLYRDGKLTATTIHQEMRITVDNRADKVASLVNGSEETWLIWCHTDYESDALKKQIPDAIDVRGSLSDKLKEDRLIGFAEGKIRVLITKPRIAGYGLNYQHCHNVAFVGLSYSFEDYFQAVRRTWRFGQTHAVRAHVIIASTEGDIIATVKRKQDDYRTMMGEMATATAETSLVNLRRRELMDVETDVARGKGWEMRLGDCVDETSKLADNSIGFTIFSPPFCNLYIYSDSMADMGNSDDDEQFLRHFGYLVPELYRVTVPGRLCAVHCKDLPKYKGRDKEAGLKDFPGWIIQLFETHKWTFHSRITIWKDPVIEMQRTKNNGLLHKTLCRDSSQVRQGMADYLLVFRKFPQDGTLMSASPVVRNHSRDNCFDRYIGSPEQVKMSNICVGGAPERKADFGLEVWQRYASPVWFDINQTKVLNYRIAKEDKDEKHICPLQLDVIERAIDLWTLPGDVVLSPFAGIGSESYQAVKQGRHGIGFELKRAYWEIACRNLAMAEAEAKQVTIYDIANNTKGE